MALKEKIKCYIKNNAGIFAGGLLALTGNVYACKTLAIVKNAK